MLSPVAAESTELPGAETGRVLARPQSAPAAVTAQRVLQILRRRWAGMVGIGLVVLGLAALFAFQLSPRYRAEAVLVIDSRKEKVTNIEAVVSGLPADNASLRSEMDVLLSRPIAGKVIDKLNLMNSPELNKALDRRPGMIGRMAFWLDAEGQRAIDAWFRGLFAGKDSDENIPADEAARIARTRVVDEYLNRLAVRNDGRSLTIKVTFEAQDPVLAARIVNTHADVYQLEQLEAKFDATRRANTWLTERVDELRKNVRDAENAVQEYRERAKLVGTARDSTIIAQQLAELNSQLVLARADRSQKDARVAQLRDMLRSNANIDSIPEVLNSQTIGRLRDAEVQAQKAVIDGMQRYGEKHPALVNARNQLEDIRRQITREVSRISASLQSDAAAARAREASLTSTVDDLQRRVGTQNLAEVRLRELEREAEASRTLFENFLNRFKETSAGTAVETADARLISPADVPELPTSPNRPLILGGGLIFGALLAIGLAILLEQIDNGARSPEDIERATGVPGIGLIPIVRTGLVDGITPGNAAVKKPLSNYAEAIRSVRTGIMMSNVDRPPKAILITSALPNEGKTVLAVSLGRSAASGGKKTILVDCDLRRATVGNHISFTAKGTLVDVLTGEKTIEDVVVKDPETALDILPGKANVANSLDLITSTQFNVLLRRLERDYDQVIIDSPPVLALSDAIALGRLVDTTVFAVRWGQTTMPVVTGALKQLVGAGVRVAGVVLTRVNPRKHATYGYGDYGYYYGKYYYGKYSGYHR